MFRDARVRDREVTASSFKQAYQRYAQSQESFYDGSVGSLDKRLAAARKLIHACEFTISRVSTSDAAPYLRVAAKLKGDVQALEGLREASLNGAAYFEEPNPPGFHEAAGHWYKGDDPDPFGTGVNPNDFSSREEFLQNNNLRSYLGDAVDNNPSAKGSGWDAEANDYAVPSFGKDMTSGDSYQTVPQSLPTTKDPRDFSHSSDYPVPQVPGNPYHPSFEPYPEPNVKNPGQLPAPGPGGAIHGDPNFRSPQQGVPPGYQPPPGTQKLPPGQEHDWPNSNTQKYHGHPPAGLNGAPVKQGGHVWDEVKHVLEPPPLEHGMIDPSDELYDPSKYEHEMGGKHDDRPAHNQWGDQPEVEHFARLHPTDKRWVTLEAQKFAAANEDAWSVPKELAIRAHNHATVETSTYDHRRSAAVSRAFVAKVVEVGRASYRPPVRQFQASVDLQAIPPEAMFL